MRNALIAAIVAAVVGAGSAGAASWANGSGSGGAPPAPPHPAPAPQPPKPAPAHAQPQATAAPKHAAPQPTGHRVTQADAQRLVAAWSAAHPGWTNPADMTHAQLLQAELEHPAVYAPDLNQTNKAIRTFEIYGTYAVMSPKLRALLRKQGDPIPTGIPYVKLSARSGAQPTTK